METNPYESPRHLSERREIASPWWLQAVQFCALSVATSVTLGALANVLNGWVSPTYFWIVMGWDSDIWLRSIGQGALEGLVIGSVLSVAFFGVGSLLTRFRLTFARASRYLAAIVISAVICAVVLGLLLMSFAEFVFYLELDEEQLRRFGWVAGCISGLEQGGALSALIALIVLVVRDWRKNRPAVNESTATAAKVAAAD